MLRLEKTPELPYVLSTGPAEVVAKRWHGNGPKLALQGGKWRGHESVASHSSDRIAVGKRCLCEAREAQARSSDAKRHLVNLL